MIINRKQQELRYDQSYIAITVSQQSVEINNTYAVNLTCIFVY